MNAAVEPAEPLPEIPWQASEAIASWRRILGQTVGDKRPNLERAFVELLRFAKTEPASRPAIVDELAWLAEDAGFDADETQAIFARAQDAPGDTRANVNGHVAGAASGQAPRFVPVAIDDVQIPTGPAYLIDGILPIRGLAVFVGEPKAGKSNLAADMAFAVARSGMVYGGRRTLNGPVFYLTREGVLGFRRRLVALRRYRGAEGEGVPFFMIDDMPTIGGEKTDVADLLRQMDGFIAERQLPPPRMIVLDTLARGMGEGDENSARDMGLAVSRCEAIERHYECLVGLVHHVGKDPQRGARGSNALNAAADVLILIEKHDGHSTARVEQMKDGPEGVEWTFRLVPFDLAETLDSSTKTDENVSACVVELLSEPAPAKQSETKTKRPPRGVAGDLFKVIRRAIEECGQRNVASDLVPLNTLAIDRAILKRYCKIMAWQDQDEKPDAFRSTLSRSLSTIRDADAIGFTQDWIWLT